MLTVNFSYFWIRDCPRQLGHGDVIINPSPWHDEHVCATEKKPCWYLTSPCPLHVWHAEGLLPVLQPVALQESQGMKW